MTFPPLNFKLLRENAAEKPNTKIITCFDSHKHIFKQIIKAYYTYDEMKTN